MNLEDDSLPDYPEAQRPDCWDSRRTPAGKVADWFFESAFPTDSEKEKGMEAMAVSQDKNGMRSV